MTCPTHLSAGRGGLLQSAPHDLIDGIGPLVARTVTLKDGNLCQLRFFPLAHSYDLATKAQRVCPLGVQQRLTS